MLDLSSCNLVRKAKHSITRAHCRNRTDFAVSKAVWRCLQCYSGATCPPKTDRPCHCGDIPLGGGVDRLKFQCRRWIMWPLPGERRPKDGAALVLGRRDAQLWRCCMGADGNYFRGLTASSYASAVRELSDTCTSWVFYYELNAEWHGLFDNEMKVQNV